LGYSCGYLAGHGRASPRQLTHQHFIEQDPQRVDICVGLGTSSSTEVFRSHIAYRAIAHISLPHIPGVSLSDPSDAKVTQLDVAIFIEEHILRS